LWSNTAFKLALDESMKTTIVQNCVQVSILPLILELFSVCILPSFEQHVAVPDSQFQQNDTSIFFSK